MNAANASLQASSIESERRAHEPSMEEILASIRKIIADDDALPLTRPAGDARSTFTTPRPFEASAAPAASEAAAPPETLVAGPEALVPSQESGAELPAAPPFPHAPEEGDPDIESLTEIANELSAHDLRPAIGPTPEDVGQEEIVAQDASPEQPAVEESGRDDGGVSEMPAILSPEADASVSSAFRALSASVQMMNAETIDRHVRELLRPMLKQWLDDNLPVMVERLVRTEIERVARGGR